MGSILYDFLADSLILNKNSIGNSYENETDARIEKELIEYRNFCIANIDKLGAEIATGTGALSVFTSASDTPIALLKQTALYMNQFVVSDPLYRYTDIETPMKRAISGQLGFNENRIDKNSIAKAASYLKSITPMVAGNFVKVFPTELIFTKPADIPLNLPINDNNNLLPPDIRDYFLKRAKVSNLERLKDGGWAIIPNGDLELGRAINIEFEGSMFDRGFLYYLTEIEVLETDEASGRIKYRQTFPDTLPTAEEFTHWVTQSVNASAKHYFDRASKEVQLSAQLNSSFLTRNELTHDLVTRNFGLPATKISDFTAQQMLNIELPFLQNINIENIMQVREGDSEVFTNFRVELEKHFRELRSIHDPIIMKQKVENIFHELNDVQVRKVQQKIKHINKQTFISTSIALGGLIGSIPTGGYSLGATLLAMVKGYKDYNEYIEKVKEQPAYFLWKINSFR